MMVTRIAFFLSLLALAWPAASYAAAGAPVSVDEDQGDSMVALPALIVPVLHNGRLWGHAYMALSLDVETQIWDVRKKVNQIQDALVRGVYRMPLTINGPIQNLGRPAPADLEPYVKLLLDHARVHTGSAKVKRIVLSQVKFQPM